MFLAVLLFPYRNEEALLAAV